MLKSINKEWCTKFPYLYLSFYKAEGKGQDSWAEELSPFPASWPEC